MSHKSTGFRIFLKSDPSDLNWRKEISLLPRRSYSIRTYHVYCCSSNGSNVLIPYTTYSGYALKKGSKIQKNWILKKSYCHLSSLLGVSHPPHYLITLRDRKETDKKQIKTSKRAEKSRGAITQWIANLQVSFGSETTTTHKTHTHTLASHCSSSHYRGLGLAAAGHMGTAI